MTAGGEKGQGASPAEGGRRQGEAASESPLRAPAWLSGAFRASGGLHGEPRRSETSSLRPRAAVPSSAQSPFLA